MVDQPNIKLVKTSGYPEYPFDRQERLKSHWFITWDFNRWLNSAFRLKAQPDVRAFAFDLFCISQNQIPVGTLPDDERQLATLLSIDLALWQDLCKREFTPLYNWTKCQCGSEVRFMHPVVTEIAQEALSKKVANEERYEAARERKKMDRLKETITKLGAGHMLKDGSVLLRIKAWLTDNVEGSWTELRVKEALETISSARL